MPTDRENGSLFVDIKGNVAHIEFGHPAGNSFVKEMLERLENAFIEVAQNDQVSVVVLKSEGERAFCAGASLTEMIQVKNLEEGKAFFGGFAKVINAMRNCHKPIIGRVQGKAVGGGIGLISSCDYVHATVDASVKLSEIAIGIAPLVIASAVERKIGKDGLAELAFYPSQWQNAYWGKEKGLFAKVHEDIATLDKELELHLDKLSTYNPEALSVMKKVLWENVPSWEHLLEERAAVSGRLSLSEHTRKALDKFKK